MNKIKKLVAAALVCVMALTLLTACGKSASDYANEVSAKLKAQNIELAADNETNTKAEKLIAGVRRVKPNELSTILDDIKTGNIDNNATAKKIISDANIDLDKNMVFVSGEVAGNNITDTDASTYFAKQIEDLNKTGKVTKIGFGVYNAPFGLANIVVMVIEYQPAK